MFYPSSFLTFFLCLLPRWVTGHWSPCSATCEKGVQHREVTCVYQLQNGTYVNTRDLYCLGNKPTTVQSCEGRDCLSIWEASEWSKVGIWFKKEARLCAALDTLALNPAKCLKLSMFSWSAYLVPHGVGTLGRTVFCWDDQFGTEVCIPYQMSY